MSSSSGFVNHLYCWICSSFTLHKKCFRNQIGLLLPLKTYDHSILLALLFVFICCTIFCHSLSLISICCHLLSLIVSHCPSLYYLLSFVLPLVVTRGHCFSLTVPLIVVIRCHSSTTRLSFYKRSKECVACTSVTKIIRNLFLC